MEGTAMGCHSECSQRLPKKAAIKIIIESYNIKKTAKSRLNNFRIFPKHPRLNRLHESGSIAFRKETSSASRWKSGG